MKTSTKIRIYAILLILFFCLLSVCFIPECAEHIISFSADSNLPLPPLAVYSVGILLCLPCLAILIISLRFVDAVERDEIFTASTAKRLMLVAYIFFIDCSLFILGIAALFFMGERLITPLFALIALVGFAIGGFLSILAGYVNRAAELKEEVDATL